MMGYSEEDGGRKGREKGEKKRKEKTKEIFLKQLARV